MAEPATQAPDDLSLMPAGRLLKTAEVVELAELVARRAAKFQSVMGDLEATIRRRGDEAAASIAAAGFSPADQQAAAQKVADKARNELIKGSDETRWGLLRELSAADKAVGMTAELCGTPQAILARVGLGTPERSHYLTQLQGSGPVQLRNMVQLALATDNKVLGAALMHIIDGMPARERPFSAADLAERLVGEEARCVQQAIRRIRNDIQSALNANREFTSGRRRPLDRVKQAMGAR